MGAAKFITSRWVKTKEIDFEDDLAVNVDYQGNLSIHDLDLGRGQVLNITSPYYTNTPASNSLVHPTVLRTKEGVDGSPYLMAVTPFANADDSTENPSIFVSDDLLTWRVPAGLTNPVFGTPATGYNSDVHIYEHTDGYFYKLWRRFVSGGNAYVYGSRSIDGINWDAATTLFEDVAATQDWASPSFHHDGSQWVIFSHNIAAANAVRKHVKSDELLTSWMAVSPTTVTPTHPNSLSWWHSDIRRLPSGRLVGLVLEGGAGGGQAGGAGGASSSWLWQSDNAGLTWSVRQLTRGRVNYRSSLVLEGNQVSVVLVWVDADAAGTPTYTTMNLHRLLPGRLERRRTQANLQTVAVYSLVVDDEQNVVGHADGFAGAAADLSAPWSQLTATAMRRNGSGAAVAANTTNPAFSVVATGALDHWARVRFLNYASGTAYLALKGIDANNYLGVGIADGSGKLAIKGVVAGVEELNELQLITPSLANNIVVRAQVDGLQLRVWVDGVLVWERAIPAGLAAGTNVGIRTTGSVANSFDEFACGRL